MKVREQRKVVIAEGQQGQHRSSMGLWVSAIHTWFYSLNLRQGSESCSKAFIADF